MLLACAVWTGAAVGAAPAMRALAVESAPGGTLGAAARLLREAELREDDQTTRDLYRQSAALAEKALEENPDSAQANFVFFAAKGRILLAEGPLKNLLRLRTIDGYLDRALQLDPDYSNALAAKGGLLLDLPFYLGGNAKQAEQILRRAVELNPTGPGTRLGFARALLRNGDPAGARRESLKAAHYACLEHRVKTLTEAQQLLSELDSVQARASVP